MHWPRVDIKDLFDHGGEGMYHEVFEQDAIKLTQEWWRHHYGIEALSESVEILSTSRRAIEWLKKNEAFENEYSFIGDLK